MLSNAFAKILQENKLNTDIIHSLTNKKAKLIIYLCSRECRLYGQDRPQEVRGGDGQLFSVQPAVCCCVYLNIPEYLLQYRVQ